MDVNISESIKNINTNNVDSQLINNKINGANIHKTNNISINNININSTNIKNNKKCNKNNINNINQTNNIKNPNYISPRYHSNNKYNYTKYEFQPKNQLNTCFASVCNAKRCLCKNIPSAEPSKVTCSICKRTFHTICLIKHKTHVKIIYCDDCYYSKFEKNMKTGKKNKNTKRNGKQRKNIGQSLTQPSKTRRRKRKTKQNIQYVSYLDDTDVDISDVDAYLSEWDCDEFDKDI